MQKTKKTKKKSSTCRCFRYFSKECFLVVWATIYTSAVYIDYSSPKVAKKYKTKRRGGSETNQYIPVECRVNQTKLEPLCRIKIGGFYQDHLLLSNNIHPFLVCRNIVSPFIFYCRSQSLFLCTCCLKKHV